MIGRKRRELLIISGNSELLTVTGHADSDALLQTAVLAPVAVDTQNGTLLVFSARTVLNLLLNAPPEKTLKTQKKKIKFPFFFSMKNE